MDDSLHNFTLDQFSDEVLTHIAGYVEVRDVHHWSLVSKRFNFLFQERVDNPQWIRQRSENLPKPICRIYKKRYKAILNGYAGLTATIFLTAVTFFSLFHIYFNIFYDSDDRRLATEALGKYAWSVIKSVGTPMAVAWIGFAVFEETGFHPWMRRIIRRMSEVYIETQFSKIFHRRQYLGDRSDSL